MYQLQKESNGIWKDEYLVVSYYINRLCGDLWVELPNGMEIRLSPRHFRVVR